MPHTFATEPPTGFALEHRLAVYGSLAPGEANAHILQPLSGSWCAGTVRGTLHDLGWAAELGYRAIRLDPASPEMPVQLFTSPDLPAFWAELDRFEGDEYARVPTQVRIGNTAVYAFIYQARERA